MTENKKINPDTIIRRFSISVTVIASTVIIIYWLPRTFVFVAAGWLIYLILYQMRGILYRQGHNRIFILGLIALASPFFSSLVSPPGAAPQWHPETTKCLMNNAYFDICCKWLAENADKYIFWKYGLAWSLFCGALLYVINVELDNPEIKRNDLTGKQITAEHLTRFNDLWQFGFDVFTVFVLILYSIPVAICWLCYSIITGTISKKITILIIDATLLVGVLVFSLWQLTGQRIFLLVCTPNLFLDYFHIAGFWRAIKEAFHQFYWFSSNGMIIILTLPLAIRTWFNISAGNAVKKQAQEKEQEQKINNTEGIFVGYDNARKPVVITDQEFNQHCLILGTTGSGKTTTLYNVVDNCLKRGLPLIFLDGKGSKILADKIGAMAKPYNRKVRVFAFDADKMPFINAYNPFASGNFTEWKNRIMTLFQMAEGRGQEHFALEEEMYINLACQILYRTGQEVDLKLLMEFLTKPQELLDIAHSIDPELAYQLTSVLGKEGKEKPLQSDIARMLNLFINSNYGHLFNTEDKEDVIRLKDCIKNGETVIFMFNASSYSLDTVKAAKMVISDINSSMTELANTQGFTKCYCIFDEFASYASSNLSETISLQRSHGMHAIIGTQSIATVSLRSPETKRIAEELVACCSTYITQKIQHQDDVELMAKIMGTKPAYEVTNQIDSRAGESTGRGTVKSVAEFKVNPQQIRELNIGEGYVYRKAAGKDPVKVKFNKII